jgi:preprotein translocase subunit SecF
MLAFSKFWEFDQNSLCQTLGRKIFTVLLLFLVIAVALSLFGCSENRGNEEKGTKLMLLSTKF